MIQLYAESHWKYHKTTYLAAVDCSSKKRRYWGGLSTDWKQSKKVTRKKQALTVAEAFQTSTGRMRVMCKHTV